MRGLPWIKLDRGILSDKKVAFCVRRHGHECLTFWIGLLTMCESGTLTMDEDIFADGLFIEAKRYAEIRDVFVTRGLVEEDESGRLVVKNWAAYQEGESTERSRQSRERKRNASATECNADATTMQRGATTDIDRDIEGDKEHTQDARASFDPVPEIESEPDDDPFVSPPRPAALKERAVAPPGARRPDQELEELLREEWSRVPRVPQPPTPDLWHAGWLRVCPKLAGVPREDLVSAVKALAVVLDQPGRYWWETTPSAETFLTKHLARFLPAATPLETLKIKPPSQGGAGSRRGALDDRPDAMNGHAAREEQERDRAALAGQDVTFSADEVLAGIRTKAAAG